MVIQNNDLAVWKKKLTGKVYQALAAECHKQNQLLSDQDSGYQVFRGGQITEFIQNFKA
jgi:hypothetical protein